MPLRFTVCACVRRQATWKNWHHFNASTHTQRERLLSNLLGQYLSLSNVFPMSQSVCIVSSPSHIDHLIDHSNDRFESIGSRSAIYSTKQRNKYKMNVVFSGIDRNDRRANRFSYKSSTTVFVLLFGLGKELLQKICVNARHWRIPPKNMTE